MSFAPVPCEGSSLPQTCRDESWVLAVTARWPLAVAAQALAKAGGQLGFVVFFLFCLSVCRLTWSLSVVAQMLL